jgi:dTDP-4-dehydrorhamnose reductase
MNNKILIIGCTGLLGYGCTTYFKNNQIDFHSISRSDFDILKDDIDKLLPYIKKSDFVINCTGIIKQVIDNYSYDEILKVNSTFPKRLAKLCKLNDSGCFHITTDCVYTGKKGNYTENDIFDAEDIYGVSKALGEGGDCMLLRTSIIGEEKERNRSLLEWAKSNRNNTIKGFTNHIWNGVTTTRLAEIIHSIIANGDYKEGLFHIHSPEQPSKYDLLQTINSIYSLNMKIEAFQTPEKCDRSLSSIKELSKKYCTKHLTDQISEMKLLFEK